MSSVVHFEVPADDPARAKKFYEKVFGWRIEPWDTDYWIVTTGSEDEPGIDGGLCKREKPGQGVRNTINVESVDKFLKKIQEAGGKVIAQKESIPGVGYRAYFADTEGNVFGVMEDDESAK